MRTPVALIGLMACGSVSNHSGPVDAAAEADAPAIDAAVDAGATCAPAPGLVARWRGDMTLRDDLGHYNGTAIGRTAYAAGRHGSAFAMNGNDAVISIADGDTLWPRGSFSVEAWVNAPAASIGGRLAAKYECGGSCPQGPATTFSSWSLDITDTGLPDFTIRAAPNMLKGITDPVHVVTDGLWHHMVGVRDVQAKQLLLYVDGVLAVSAPLTGGQLDPMSNSDGEVDPVTIGASRNTAKTDYVDYLLGAIDEVAYFNVALTAAQIKVIHDAPDGECH